MSKKKKKSKKIGKKITGYAVKTPEDQASQEAAEDDVVHMNEGISRPEVLSGTTYKVKTPVTDHAMYITINDIVLNEGTVNEVRRPFEVFINSKNMENFQWVVALTRLMSAVFRKGGDTPFLAEELKAVFDPKGGYFQPGGRYMSSVVAEFGHVIEKHMQMLGMIPVEKLDANQKAFLEKKRAEIDSSNSAEETDKPEE